MLGQRYFIPEHFTLFSCKESWDCPRRKISMSNETRWHTQVLPYHFRDKRPYRGVVARVFSRKSSPREIEAEIHLTVSSPRIICTTYTRHDLPLPATVLPLKQWYFLAVKIRGINAIRMLLMHDMSWIF